MKNERGLTLIEVVIASAILAAVLTIAFAVLWSTQSAYNEASIAQNLEARCRTFMDTYKKEFAFCRVTTIGADGSSIRYQLPLSNQASGALNYGYSHQGVNYNGADCELVFVPTTLYSEGTVLVPPPSGATSMAMNMDMNSDGDLSDVFVSGRIERRIWNGVTLLDSSTVSDQVLLGRAGASYEVDIDNDGTVDRIFTVLDTTGNIVPAAMLAASAVRFRLMIWHGAFNDKQTRYVLRKLSDEWVFRNDQ